MTEPPASPRDPFRRLRLVTDARIGLGRAGQGLPTAPMLAFQLAHARARDAVYAEFDTDRLARDLGGALTLSSAASDRDVYLRNPELGRRLADGTPSLPRGDHDLAIVIADGLSAAAVHAHATTVTRGLVMRLSDWRIAPPVLARQGRVAIGDPIGEALGARIVVVLIGERPGLSAADSLGAYLTFAPRPGRQDNERNCVSNIRTPGGLEPEAASRKIAWLLQEARHLGLTGVALKDRSDASSTLPYEPTLEANLDPRHCDDG